MPRTRPLCTPTSIFHSSFGRKFLLVYTPFATLRHVGHASLGKVHQKPSAPDKADIYLLKRWGGYTSTDPYYTENMRDMLYKDSPTKYRMTGVNHCGVDKTRGDILLVTHDLDEALYLGRRIVLMSEGKLIADLPSAASASCASRYST